MRKKNLSPSRLAHLRASLERKTELTDNQRDMLLTLIDSQVENKQDSATMLCEWFRRGQPIIDALEKEMTALQQLAASDGELISKDSLKDILDSYKIHNPKNPADNSINWLLDRIENDVASLPGSRRK